MSNNSNNSNSVGSMDDFINLIQEIPHNYSTTNQVYGIAYLLYLGPSKNQVSEEFLLDLILSRLTSVPGNENHFYISEYDSPRNYYVSHYYNFTLNLMSYVGILEYMRRHPASERYGELERVLRQIEDFLNYEKGLIPEIDKKTVGFELIVGTYIDRVRGFNDKVFVKKYKELKKARLRKFSPTIVFTPEGIDSHFQNLLATLIANKGLSRDVEGVYVLNSAQASARFSYKLNGPSLSKIDDFNSYVNEYKGTPPFFKAEIFDCFWMVDIAASAGLLSDKQISKSLVKLVEDLDMFNPQISGCFNNEKGFSIAKGFSLYDSDTTSLGIKSLSLLGLRSDKVSSYRFDYYKNKDNGTYYSFKNDNRPSVTTMAHIIDAMVATDQDITELKRVVDKMVEDRNFVDKWHTSELYSLYILLFAYLNMFLKLGIGEKQVHTLIDAMLDYQDDTGGFSSNKELSNSVEESCWAFLALYNIDRNCDTFHHKYKQSFERLKSYLSERVEDAKIENLEKLWVVKEIYHQSRVTRALIEVVKIVL